MLSAQSIVVPSSSDICPSSAIAREDLIKDVTLSIISHPYLDDLLEKIRHEPIPWQDYERAGLITEDERVMVEHIENKSPEEITSIISEHGIHYAGLYLELMQNLARVDAVQKVLVLVHDMLNDHDERIFLFHEASVGRPDFPFGPFHKQVFAKHLALRINDEFIGIQASKILTLLICSTSHRDIDIGDFFRWMTFQLQSRNAPVTELNIQILDALFHIPAYRKAFWQTPHAVDSLVAILKRGNNNPQKVYEITFAIWLLTFDDEIAAQLNRKHDVLPSLVDIAKHAVKEKVIRVVVAIFKNLIERAPRANLSAMLVVKVLPFAEHLSTRKWSDQEIVEDIEFVKTQLQENFQSLTTFEAYAAEVETGKLEWTPPHQSDNFWRQNAGRLNDQDYHLLRLLTRLMSSSNNPTVLAIACHDLGQYVKYTSSDGRKRLQEVGAKQRIMELMTHQDPEVRYHALSATQKYFSMSS
ncbi:armadillo-type protein [Radiomyces spectabilis]|uniref:armadillo-type protein n=1 Tax=Radiomyces spectabilis TaxID=64574 RepID=UPI00221EEDAF|nr:armadillo-type protein [Radiomyces spectabilis]KAI8393735.1 armadillo-type protein [Radiomyces spectabilis]